MSYFFELLLERKMAANRRHVQEVRLFLARSQALMLANLRRREYVNTRKQY